MDFTSAQDSSTLSSDLSTLSSDLSTLSSDLSTLSSDLSTISESCSNGSCSLFMPDIDFARIEYIRDLMRKLTLYSFAPIVALGLMGNSLAFCVMIRRSLTSSTYTYLCALCVMDNLFLAVSGCGWIVYYFHEEGLRYYIDCNVYYILTRVPKQTTAWLLVAISIERFLVIYLPMRTKQICDVKRARFVILGIILANMVLSWDSFGGYFTIRDRDVATGEDLCSPRSGQIAAYLSEAGAWVRTCVYSFVPSTLLIALNGGIIAKFAHASRTRAKVGILNDHQIEMGEIVAQVSAKTLTMAKQSRRMTVICVVLSVAFLSLTLPSTIDFVYLKINNDYYQTHVVEFVEFYIVYQMLGVLVHLNHATNFALYCFTSSRFRQNLLSMLFCKKPTKTSSVLPTVPTVPTVST